VDEGYTSLRYAPGPSGVPEVGGLNMENEQSAGNLDHSDSLAFPVPTGKGQVEPQELSKWIATLAPSFLAEFFQKQGGTASPHNSPKAAAKHSPIYGPGFLSSVLRLGAGGYTSFCPVPPSEALPDIRRAGVDSYISDHMCKHVRPETDEEFGYYLAGLIEGDGWFGNNRFEIAFASEDTFLAYFIKKKIGYGSVLNLKGAKKNSVRYVLRHSEGLKRVLRLVNGKFLANYKINQLLKHGYDIKFNTAILPPANFDLNSNYWLSGFSDADGSFVIYIPRPSALPIKNSQALQSFASTGDGCLRLVSYPFLCSPPPYSQANQQELTGVLQRELVFGYKIKQGRSRPSALPSGACQGRILKIIQEFFVPPSPLRERERGGRGGGSSIYFLDKEQVFYYNSASATASAVVFNYFDKFQLNSSKLIRYLKWRQAYRIVQRKEHLTEKGLNKIRKLQGNLRD
jgi:hypothetical protein